MPTRSSVRSLLICMIILGGVLGLFFSIISFLSTSMMANIMGYEFATVWQYASMLGQFGMIGYPSLGVGLYQIMVLWSVLSLTGASLAACGGIWLARTFDSKAISLSFMGGILLLLAFVWLPAIIVIVSSIVLVFRVA